MIESAAVSADQSRLTAAKFRVGVAGETYSREARLEKKGISAKREVLAAEQELREARAEYEALRASLGIVGANGGSGGRYTLSAPLAGVVTQRNVSVDRYVDSETTLFEIVDTSSMWAEVAVPEAALGDVGVGRPVVLAVDGLGGREFQGTVSHIAPVVDPQTRTAKARVRLANPDGLLRANMYGRARITAAVANRASAAVPRDAIQRAKTVHLAFVRLAVDEYEARRVQLTPNRREGDLVEVSSGLEPGEEVVVAGSFFLKPRHSLMPVFASLGLRHKVDEKELLLIRLLKGAYRPVLRFALRRRFAVLAVALACLGGAGLLATRLGSEFVPRLQEGEIVINTIRLASVSLDESVRYGTRIEQALLDPSHVARASGALRGLWRGKVLECMETLSIALQKGVNVHAVKGNRQLDHSL